MTDRLDDLLFSIGEEQNDRVDFDQMYADLLQKQKEEEKKPYIMKKLGCCCSGSYHVFHICG